MPIASWRSFFRAKHDNPQSEGVDRARLKRVSPFQSARGPTDSSCSPRFPDRARRSVLALPLSAVRPSPARGHAGQEGRSPGGHADIELPQVDKSGFLSIRMVGLAGYPAVAASVANPQKSGCETKLRSGCETMNTESRQFHVANGIIVVIATALLAACSSAPPPPPPQPAYTPPPQPAPPAYTPEPAPPAHHRG